MFMTRPHANQPIKTREVTIKDTRENEVNKIKIKFDREKKTIDVKKTRTEKSVNPVLNPNMLTSVKEDLNKLSKGEKKCQIPLEINI